MTKEEFFKKYFDCTESEFDWDSYTIELVRNYPNDIEIWWDENKFNWDRVWLLIECCRSKLNVWYNPKKIEWNRCYYLYDTETSKRIEEGATFELYSVADYFKKHYSEYKDIWESDYLLSKIT